MTVADAERQYNGSGRINFNRWRQMACCFLLQNLDRRDTMAAIFDT